MPKNPSFTKASEIAELLALDMRLLRQVPNHCQAGETRAHIEKEFREHPEVHAMAKMIVDAENAEARAKGQTDGVCNRCKNAGTFEYQGRVRFCGCRSGKAAARSQGAA